jgi:hypothetical protein
MSFFGGNRRRGTGSLLGGYATKVEKILSAIGVDPMQARMKTERDFAWSFMRGTAIIEIYVTQQNNIGHFQVLSPIMHLPQGGLLPLYRRLLELNLRLNNAALGVYLDVVYLYYERTIENLDAGEANEIITTIARYADELDNQLVQEFGGRLYTQV